MSVPGDEPDRSADIGQWIEAARGGCRESLGRLLEVCRPYLLLVANQELAPELRGKVSPSDLVQETFLKAQGNMGRFHGHTEDELLAWLRRILLNHLANERRRFGYEVALDSGGQVDARAAGGAAPSPSGQAIAREELSGLERALEKLPEHYRQVVQWRNWERLSFEEIGRRSGRSAEAARKLWARAVEQLAQELESDDESR